MGTKKYVAKMQVRIERGNSILITSSSLSLLPAHKGTVSQLEINEATWKLVPGDPQEEDLCQVDLGYHSQSDEAERPR